VRSDDAENAFRIFNRRRVEMKPREAAHKNRNPTEIKFFEFNSVGVPIQWAQISKNLNPR
jgi:hypothetical protein